MKETRPPVAKRIAEARERAGLSADSVAERVGLEPMSYYDLEHYDDEAFMAVSVAELSAVARAVGCSPRSLLAPTASVVTTVSMQEVVQRIREVIAREQLSPEAFSERAGWDVTGVLANPESAWTAWSVDALQDVCAQVGVDWLAVIPAS